MNCPKCNEDIMSMSVHYCNIKTTMNTPTPRTDEAWAAWQYAGSGMSVHVGRELERELTAAREKLAKAGVGDYKADYFLGELTETGKLRSELKAVTEQRDALAEALREVVKSVDPYEMYKTAKRALEISSTRRNL